MKKIKSVIIYPRCGYTFIKEKIEIPLKDIQYIDSNVCCVIKSNILSQYINNEEIIFYLNKFNKSWLFTNKDFECIYEDIKNDKKMFDEIIDDSQGVLRAIIHQLGTIKYNETDRIKDVTDVLSLVNLKLETYINGGEEDE